MSKGFGGNITEDVKDRKTLNSGFYCRQRHVITTITDELLQNLQQKPAVQQK